MSRRLPPLCSVLALLAIQFGAPAQAAATAPAPPNSPKCWHADAKIEQEIGYCAAVRVGNTLHISGVVAEGPMDQAVRSVYGELKQVLQAHGLGFEHVVKETAFATDLDALIRHKAIRKTFYGNTLPAASWVQVQRLYLPSYVLEVELTAEFPH